MSDLVFMYLLFQHGNTALHEAAWKGYSQTVGVLCRYKHFDCKYLELPLEKIRKNYLKKFAIFSDEDKMIKIE